MNEQILLLKYSKQKDTFIWYYLKFDWALKTKSKAYKLNFLNGKLIQVQVQTQAQLSLDLSHPYLILCSTLVLSFYFSVSFPIYVINKSNLAIHILNLVHWFYPHFIFYLILKLYTNKFWNQFLYCVVLNEVSSEDH